MMPKMRVKCGIQFYAKRAIPFRGYAVFQRKRTVSNELKVKSFEFHSLLIAFNSLLPMPYFRGDEAFFAV